MNKEQDQSKQLHQVTYFHNPSAQILFDDIADADCFLKYKGKKYGFSIKDLRITSPMLYQHMKTQKDLAPDKQPEYVLQTNLPESLVIKVIQLIAGFSSLQFSSNEVWAAFPLLIRFNLNYDNFLKKYIQNYLFASINRSNITIVMELILDKDMNSSLRDPLEASVHKYVLDSKYECLRFSKVYMGFGLAAFEKLLEWYQQDLSTLDPEAAEGLLSVVPVDRLRKMIDDYYAHVRGDPNTVNESKTRAMNIYVSLNKEGKHRLEEYIQIRMDQLEYRVARSEEILFERTKRLEDSLQRMERKIDSIEAKIDNLSKFTEKLSGTTLFNIMKALTMKLDLAFSYNFYKELDLPNIVTQISATQTLDSLTESVAKDYACLSRFDSKVLSIKDQLMVEHWVKQYLKFEDIELLWRGTRDGFQAATFHALCDGKGPTILAVKSGESIFGAFCSLSHSSSGAWKRDFRSFIFSLTHRRVFPFEYEGSDRTVYNIWHDPESILALGCCRPGAQVKLSQVYISDDCNLNEASYFLTADEVSGNESYKIDVALAAERNFRIDEMECFRFKEWKFAE